MKKIIILGLSLSFCFSTVEAAQKGIGNVIIQGVNHGVQSLGNNLLNSLLPSRYQMAAIGAGMGFVAPKAVETAQAAYENPWLIPKWIVKHPLSLAVAAGLAWKKGYNRGALSLGISSLFFVGVHDVAKNKPNYIRVIYSLQSKSYQKTFAVYGDTLNLNELMQKTSDGAITQIDIGPGIQHIGGSLSWQSLRQISLPEGIKIDQNNLSNVNTKLQINAPWTVINGNSVLRNIAKGKIPDCGSVQLPQQSNKPTFDIPKAINLNQPQPTTLRKALKKVGSWIIKPCQYVDRVFLGEE